MAEEQGLSAENVRLTQMHASFMLSYGESFRHRLNDLLNAARSEGRAKPPQGDVGADSGLAAADDNHKALVEALRADLEQVIHQLDDPYTDGWGDNDALIQGEIERLQNMHRSLTAFQSRQEESRG